MSTPNQQQQQQHSPRNVVDDEGQHLQILNKLHACCDPGEFQELLLQARAVNFDLLVKFRIEKKENKKNNSDGDEDEKIEEEAYYGTLLHGAVLDGHEWKMRAIFEEVEERRKLQIKEKEKDSNEEQEKEKKKGNDGGEKRSEKEPTAQEQGDQETEGTTTTEGKRSNDDDDQYESKMADIFRTTLDENGQTILHWAAARHDIYSVRKIMSFDSQICLIQDNQGKTALHRALLSEKKDGNRYILGSIISSCKSNEEMIELILKADNEGKTVLNYCVERKDFRLFRDLRFIKTSQQRSLDGERWLEALRKTVNRDGQTMLHLAVSKQEISLVEWLVSLDEALCFVQDKGGKTALHLAAELRWIRAVSAILDGCKSDEDRMKLVLIKVNNGQTILQDAVNQNWFWIVEYLMRQDWFVKDERTGVIFRIPVNANGESIFHRTMSAEVAWWMIDMLMIIDDDLAFIQDADGKTVLHIAAVKCKQNPDIFKAILFRCETEQKKKELLWMTDKQGTTAIEVVIQNGAFDIIEWICCQKWATEERRIGELICENVDGNGQTILHRAVEGNIGRIVHALSSTFSDLIFVQDKDGKTALHLASLSGRIRDSFIALLDRCKNDEERMRLIAIKDNNGRTAIQDAADHDSFAIVKYLMEQDWFVNAERPVGILRIPVNGKGETILHRAVASNSHATVRTLSSTFSDLLFVQDMEGKTALHAAAGPDRALDSCISILHGCKSDEERLRLVLMRDNAGQSVVHSAANCYFLSVIEHMMTQEWFLKSQQTLDILRGTVSKRGQTILHRAAWRNAHVTIRTLISIFNELIFIQDNDGKTALHIAAQSDRVDACIAILDGCKSDEDRMRLVLFENNNHRSAIVNAVEYNSFSIVSHLMKQEWFLKNEQMLDVLRAPLYEKGQTILHRAASRGSYEATQALLDYDITLFTIKDACGLAALHRATIELAKIPRYSLPRSLLFDKDDLPRMEVDPNIRSGLSELA